MIELIYGSAIALIAVFALLRRSHHPSVALGGTILAGFFFPAYWEVDVLDLPITVQTLAAIIGLLGYVATGGSLRFRLTICDLAIATVLLAHIASDALIHRGGWVTPFFAYGEWVLPYASGRYAFGRISELAKLRWLTISLAIYFAALFLIDVFGGVNVLYDFTNLVTGWEPPLRAKRFGLVRSSGTTAHPIFFSGMLLALCPVLVISLSDNRRADPRKKYWIAMATVLLVALLLSRAAVLAALIGIAFHLAARHRGMRYGIVIAGGILVAVLAVNRDEAMRLWQITGGRTDDRKEVVTIDGEEKIHNSSLARLRLYDVYGRAAWRAGVFGYGTEAVTGFPPNLPYLPKEALATEVVWTVENSYLLMLLRFGWVGVAAFAILMFSPIAMTILQPSLELREHLWCLTASIIAVAALLATVYSAYEITFPLLWILGLSSGLVDRGIGSTESIATAARSRRSASP